MRVQPAAIVDFAADVRGGLSRHPKQLSPLYFYDTLGLALFEAICRLPWYRITASELALLRAHRDEILSPRPGALAELGCGTGEKLEVLAEALHRDGHPATLHLIDASAAALEQTAQRVERFATGAVHLHQTTYSEGLLEIKGAAPLVLFLGSNIGNLHMADAAGFLRAIRAALGDARRGWGPALERGSGLLLGADLVKPERDLLLAYDDPLGLTAAFNKNLLLRINRELGANFALDRFEHRAVWNAEQSRVEMHLISRRAQTVEIPGAECVVSFEAGESIWTESSYKYAPDMLPRMGGEAGFRCERQWIDEEARFALTLFRAG